MGRGGDGTKEEGIFGTDNGRTDGRTDGGTCGPKKIKSRFVTETIATRFAESTLLLNNFKPKAGEVSCFPLSGFKAKESLKILIWEQISPYQSIFGAGGEYPRIRMAAEVFPNDLADRPDRVEHLHTGLPRRILGHLIPWSPGVLHYQIVYQRSKSFSLSPHFAVTKVHD